VLFNKEDDRTLALFTRPSRRATQADVQAWY